MERNRGARGYREKQAQQRSDDRKASKKTRNKVIYGELEKEVVERLRRKHSPEQIAMHLPVSHETIYKYIIEDKEAGGDLYKELRINGKRRYRRRVGTRRTKIQNRTDIDERPKIVADRKRYGDWEVDLVEGKKGTGYFLTLYERKSRYGIIIKLETKTAEETTNAIISALSKYKVKTITYDNGLEFSGHETVSERLEAKGYFCKPYHSWEKGGVENYNGLVRQYFPKGTGFEKIGQEELERVQQEINERPREILNGKWPAQFEKKISA